MRHDPFCFYIRHPDGSVEPAPSILSWAEFRLSCDHIVGQTEIGPDVTVSTVFLGIDHGHGRSDKPVLWETMVFRSSEDGRSRPSWRYTSEADAKRGHELVVSRLREEPNADLRTLLGL